MLTPAAAADDDDMKDIIKVKVSNRTKRQDAYCLIFTCHIVDSLSFLSVLWFILLLVSWLGRSPSIYTIQDGDILFIVCFLVL